MIYVGHWQRQLEIMDQKQRTDKMLDEVHIMLDLETFGLPPNSVIRSIGAVEFCPVTGKQGDEFYCNVDEQSCLKLGMIKDPGTVDWWNQPDKVEAQKQLLVDPLPIAEALARFTKFWSGCQGEFIWSQGSNFDEPMLSWTYRAAKQRAPWKFFNTRDTRTIYHLGEFNTFTIKRGGTYHNALDDAKHQAMCVHRSYQQMRGKSG